jgi:hypothetical protein
VPSHRSIDLGTTTLGLRLRRFAHANECQNQKTAERKRGQGLLVLLNLGVPKHCLQQAVHRLLGVLKRCCVAKVLDEARQGKLTKITSKATGAIIPTEIL